MSRYVVFDLDELTALRFQDLCNALLLKHFSQLIDSMVRPGRDGQCDGKSEMLPVHYADLFKEPLAYRAPNGQETLWVFQCKHTQAEDEKSRQNAVLQALQDEIKKWEKKIKRPTHYILLTNVNLRNSNREKIIDKGRKFFGHFDLWHEPKISGFISDNSAFQKAYFPNRLSNLDIATLALAMERAEKVIEKADRQASDDGIDPLKLNEYDTKASVQALVDYEIRFYKANQSFSQALQLSETYRKCPNEWTAYSYIAKSDGILTLSENIEGIKWLNSLIARNEVKVEEWSRFLGEEVTRGDIVMVLKCNPDALSQLSVCLDAIFNIISSATPAYVQVDRYLRDIESKILRDLRESKIQDVQDGLRQLYRMRQSYAAAKAEYSSAFYPNARTLAGKPMVGWDFLNLWGNVFRNIYDVALGEKMPDAIYELLWSIPFVACGDAIRQRRSREALKLDLEVLKVPLGAVVKEKNSDFLTMFLDKLENLAQELSDTDVNIELPSQAEWAIAIASELTRYIADLGWLSLSQKIPQLPLDQLERFLGLATSLSFDSLLHKSGSALKDSYLIRKESQNALGMLKREYIFAWATFSWSRERELGSYDPAIAIRLLRQLKMSDVVTFYSSNKFARSGWITEWFIPYGKRIDWSLAIDHDVREALQLAALILPIEVKDFSGLIELADRSWSKTFLEEMQKLSTQLTSRGLEIDYPQRLTVLEEAISWQESHLKALLAKQPLCERRVDEVREEFKERLLPKSKEGVLYSIANIGSRPDLKPTHAVGPYFLENKSYFVDQLGSVSYLNNGIGDNCANLLNVQREQLLVESAKKSAVMKEYDLSKLEGMLKEISELYKSDYYIIVSQSMLPQFMDSPQFHPRKAGENRQFYGTIGALRVVSSGELQHGEILIVPHLGFVWYADKKVTDLNIALIDKNSALGKRIVEANPDISLEESVLLDGRERGVMVIHTNVSCWHYKELSQDSVQ